MGTRARTLINCVILTVKLVVISFFGELARRLCNITQKAMSWTSKFGGVYLSCFSEVLFNVFLVDKKKLWLWRKLNKVPTVVPKNAVKLAGISFFEESYYAI